MLHIFGICEEMYNFNFNGDLQKNNNMDKSNYFNPKEQFGIRHVLIH